MAYNVIWVGPADGANRKPLTVEGTATEIGIRPGMLVTVLNGEMAKSANDGTTASQLLIAREIGEQFGSDITVAWTNGSNAISVAPRSGEFFNVSLAAAQTIVDGDALTSAGNGQFKKAGAADAIYCYAQAASTGAAANTLLLATV